MEIQQKDLPLKIKIELQGNSYEIEFPSINQLIEIESNKVLLSNNTYGALAIQNLTISNIALSYIDAIATFSVLIPDLVDGLRVNSLTDLSLEQGQEITKQYIEVFAPWFWNWIEQIKGTSEDLEKAKDNLKEVEDESNKQLGEEDSEKQDSQ